MKLSIIDKGFISAAFGPGRKVVDFVTMEKAYREILKSELAL